MRIQAVPLDATPGGAMKHTPGGESQPAIPGLEASENFIQTELIIHTFGYIGATAPAPDARPLVAAGD